MRQCRKLAAAVNFLVIAGLAWLATASAAGAGAAQPAGGGPSHAQLVGRFSPNSASSRTPALASSGSGIIAVVVATLAVLALAFLIVTFIRRRTVIA